MNGNFLYNATGYLRWKQDHMKLIWKHFSITLYVRVYFLSFTMQSKIVKLPSNPQSGTPLSPFKPPQQ